MWEGFGCANLFYFACFAILLFVAAIPAHAQEWRLSRTSLNFGSVVVGESKSLGIEVNSLNDSEVTVSAFSSTLPQFRFEGGIIPDTIHGGGMPFSFTFIPTAAQSYSGTITLTINGTPATITLTGTGMTTGAVATLTPSALYFDNQLPGTMSLPRTVKIANSGTTPLNIEGITTVAPFSTGSFKVPHRLNPGESVYAPVSYFGGYPASAVGSLVVTYDVLPAKNVALHGLTAHAADLAIVTYPSLQLGTAGFAYLVPLVTAGGKGNVAWSLASGSTLPSGLSLSSAGIISGTIDSTVPLATYNFTIQATDGGKPPQTASSTFSLTVLAPTGASCNNISWNVSGTTTPMVDMPDLGTGSYLGSEGGLYFDGSNQDSAQHYNDGINFAQSLTPLDANGNPDPVNGQMVMLGLGISTIGVEMGAFVPMANGDPEKNPSVLVMNGTEPHASATDFADRASLYWSTLVDDIIPNAGASPNQVVAVLFEDIDKSPKGTYPKDDVQLQSELESVAQNILSFFPNAKMLFYQPRAYSGFSNGVSSVDPEPYVYEQGFAIRGAIEDQISGLPSLNYNPASGPVMAPWLSWGPYTWANGMIPNSSGLAYSCQDFIGSNDGHHPSQKYGAPKIAAQFLNFFKTSPLTVPWFLAAGH
jgi:hypothetical protein